MKTVDKITVSELQEMASKMYGTLVKAVVDIRKEVLVVDAELHADQEKYLLENDSAQSDLWGINLYPEDYGTDDFIEFDSMINIRPRQGNRSRDVEDNALRKEIIRIVTGKVADG
jgi:hypothetical protein